MASFERKLDRISLRRLEETRSDFVDVDDIIFILTAEAARRKLDADSTGRRLSFPSLVLRTERRWYKGPAGRSATQLLAVLDAKFMGANKGVWVNTRHLSSSDLDCKPARVGAAVLNPRGTRQVEWVQVSRRQRQALKKRFEP